MPHNISLPPQHECIAVLTMRQRAQPRFLAKASSGICPTGSITLTKRTVYGSLPLSFAICGCEHPAVLCCAVLSRFLDRPYGRVDRPKLKRTLLERCVAQGTWDHGIWVVRRSGGGGGVGSVCSRGGQGFVVGGACSRQHSAQQTGWVQRSHAAAAAATV
jgi:hypothetical protein